jgi:putative ABC transport system permease protein
LRIRDLVALALSALVQQKTRTLLTTLGVVFGTFVLVASLSVRLGVGDTIEREYSRYGELRRINVFPKYQEAKPSAEEVAVHGEMSEQRRERLHKQLSRQWQQRHAAGPVVGLTMQRLGDLAALEHVDSVEPFVAQAGRAFFEGRSEPVTTVTGSANDDFFKKRMIAGQYVSAADSRGVVVSEYLLYLLGVQDEKAMEDTLGKKIRLEFRTGAQRANLMLHLLNLQPGKLTAEEEALLEKLRQALPEALGQLPLTAAERALLEQMLRRPEITPKSKDHYFVEEYAIRGIMRLPGEDDVHMHWSWPYEEAGVVLPASAAAAQFLRVPGSEAVGFHHVMVQVDSLDHVKEVTAQIRQMGLQANSLVDLIDREQLIYLLIFTAMTVIALVSLLVAALGIINTMLMSVLERIREIGIMKAVGAREGHVQMIFLMEGALVGLVGGLLGLVLGWAGSFPGDAWVRGLVQQRLSIKLQASIFSFPWWLVLGVPTFACLVTTLAAVYPARRAARVDPVTALRHD